MSLRCLCSVCEAWPVKAWNKLRRSLGDASLRAIQRGKPHWTFPCIEALITNRPTSAADSSEPWSEISSIGNSGDSALNQIVSTKGSVLMEFEVHESIGVTTNMADPALLAASTALPSLVTAMPLTPGTIQTIQISDVTIVDLPQATPSVSGSAGGVQILRTAEQRLQDTLAQPPTSHFVCLAVHGCTIHVCLVHGCAVYGHAGSGQAGNGHACSSHAVHCHAVYGFSICYDGYGFCRCTFEYSRHSVSWLLYA